jgi:hypothetical protein
MPSGGPDLVNKLISISINQESRRIKNFIFSNFGPTRGIQRSTYKGMKKTNKEDMTHFVI